MDINPRSRVNILENILENILVNILVKLQHAMYLLSFPLSYIYVCINKFPLQLITNPMLNNLIKYRTFETYEGNS